MKLYKPIETPVTIWTLILSDQDDRGEITTQTGNSYLERTDAELACYRHVAAIMDDLNAALSLGEQVAALDYWRLVRQETGWVVLDEDDRYCGGANWEERKLILDPDLFYIRNKR